MSIIRLSCKRDVAYAPQTNGQIVGETYDKRQHTGMMEAFEPPKLIPHRADIAHYINWTIDQNVSQLTLGSPVTFLVHGFLFDPFDSVHQKVTSSDNPHRRMFGFETLDQRTRIRTHAAPWPLDLGFAQDDHGAAGLAVGFGWHSNPGFFSSLIKGGQNFYSRAYGYANESSWVFACVLEYMAAQLKARGHNQPLDIVAHSLGSRVVVRALAKTFKYASLRDADFDGPDMTAARRARAIANRDRFRELTRRLGRIIFMGGSEYVVEAQLLYDRLLRAADTMLMPLDQGPQFYNVVSRENDILDLLGENFGPRTSGNTNVIGHNGLGYTMDNPDFAASSRWCDMQIDSRNLRQWMELNRNIEVSGDRPGNIWDHYYYYTWMKNNDLYRGILRDRDNWTIPTLLQEGMPQEISHGWFGD